MLLQACEKKQWSLVRHTAGLLQKRVEDLAEVSMNQIFSFRLLFISLIVVLYLTVISLQYSILTQSVTDLLVREKQLTVGLTKVTTERVIDR